MDNLASRVVCDADAFRLHIAPAVTSPEGLFRLGRFIIREFPGLQVDPEASTEEWFALPLIGYRGKHDLSTMDTETFNGLAANFSPFKAVSPAGLASPFEIQALFEFVVTQEFCDELLPFVRHLGVTDAVPHGHLRQVMALTVDRATFDKSCEIGQLLGGLLNCQE